MRKLDWVGGVAERAVVVLWCVMGVKAWVVPERRVRIARDAGDAFMVDMMRKRYEV